MEKVKCFISGLEMDVSKCIRFDTIRESVASLIRKDYPAITKKDYLSSDELNKYRKIYLESMVIEESGELNQMEQEVIDAIQNNRILSQNIEPDIEEELTLGQRVADFIADFGGSWIFILSFFLFLIFWILVNIWILAARPFDPYPFILLNLILSCIAAIQAPVIMMSQNRQEQKDRIRGEHDYQVNLKAELEIKLLHEKIDHLIIHQNKRLMEIQEIQADYLEEIIQKLNGRKQGEAGQG